MAESGHAINLAHFSDLITAVESFGNRYNPSNAALAVKALKDQRDAVKIDIKALSDADTALSTAGNARKALFDPLDTLTRRIIASAKSAGATTDQLSDMEETARKIKGERAGTKNPDPLNPGDPKSISVSQQSFVNLASHLGGLITTLKSVPAYAPNEADLKATALETLQSDMETANDAASGAERSYNQAKIRRDTGMYGKGTGLVDTAGNIKEYVFSASKEGAKSADYKAIKGISFSRPKK